MVQKKLLTERLLKCLESKGIRVKAMYLFGSHARNEARKDSDIDVLVVSPSFTGKNFWSRCGMAGRAISNLPDPVEIYPVTPAEYQHPERGGFLEAILPDCQVLYRAKKNHHRRRQYSQPVAHRRK